MRRWCVLRCTTHLNGDLAGLYTCMYQLSSHVTTLYHTSGHVFTLNWDNCLYQYPQVIKWIAIKASHTPDVVADTTYTELETPSAKTSSFPDSYTNKKNLMFWIVTAALCSFLFQCLTLQADSSRTECALSLSDLAKYDFSFDWWLVEIWSCDKHVTR